MLFSSDTPEKYLTFPHHITVNLGKGESFLEFGLGGTIINGNTSNNYLLYPIIGYRTQSLRSNVLNFRIFCMVYNFWNLGDDEDVIFFPIGMSLGYILK